MTSKTKPKWSKELDLNVTTDGCRIIIDFREPAAWHGTVGLPTIAKVAVAIIRKYRSCHDA
jgi:hypothetical protein